MYTDGNNYHFAEQQMGYNNLQPQHINCSPCTVCLPTWTIPEQKSHGGDSAHILKNALVYGSAAVQKNYQADSSEDNNSQCSTNSTKSDYSQLFKNMQKENFRAGEDSVPPSLLQNERTIIPLTYNNPIYINNNSDQRLLEWNAHAEGVHSSSASGHQQQLSPNMMPYESPERYQQNVQNNYGQNHVVYDPTRFNTGYLTVPAPMMQYKSMEHAIHTRKMQEKYKREQKKNHFAFKGDTFGQERRSRQTYTAAQTALLEKTFQENEYVSKDIRNMLAEKTKLDIKQIKIWFQNRRMKQKRHISTKLPATYIPPNPDAEASTLSNAEAQPQLQPAVQHHEAVQYQNYSYGHQQHQQNIINQCSYIPNYENIFSGIANQSYGHLGN